MQRVGYRDFVAEIANGLTVCGMVENLPDNSVKIIAEAEKGTLENFIRQIQPGNDPMIKVTNITVRFEPATNEFEYFDIKYEDFVKEGFESIGTAAVYLKKIDKTLGGIDKKQDKMLEKQDEIIKVLGGKIDNVGMKVDQVGSKVDALRDETKQNFSHIDIKYDKMSDKMDSMDKTLQKLTEAILKLAERR